MKVNYCLILAAGYGTRMGELGQLLPKPLWPIFNKRMLELQVEVARSYGVEKIYINTHHLAHEIEEFIAETKLDVAILHEKKLLGSGGAIHNLASLEEVNYQGNLLIINSDQFYLFDEYSRDEFLVDSEYDVRLVAINVNKAEKYNSLILNERKLKSISKEKEHKEDYITYSGISLINLSKIKPVRGYSNFFESVADYKSLNVEVLNPLEQEYWDFGTKELYSLNIRKLLKESEKCKLVQFLSNYVEIQSQTDLLKIDDNELRIIFKNKMHSI